MEPSAAFGALEHAIALVGLAKTGVPHARRTRRLIRSHARAGGALIRIALFIGTLAEVPRRVGDIDTGTVDTGRAGAIQNWTVGVLGAHRSAG